MNFAGEVHIDFSIHRNIAFYFHLLAGHCHLSSQVYRLGLSHTPNCPCQTAPQTSEHILQSCPLHKEVRNTVLVQDSYAAGEAKGAPRNSLKQQVITPSTPTSQSEVFLPGMLKRREEETALQKGYPLCCLRGPRPGAGIMEVDDRQVTTVQPSFHHRHSTNRVS